MSAPAIRFVIQVFSTWNKTNGYSSRCGRITSTLTGKSLSVHDVGGDENLSGDVGRAFDCFPSDIALNIVSDVSRDEYRRLVRAMERAERSTAFAVTREMLDALEVAQG